MEYIENMTKILHLPLEVFGSEQNGQRKGLYEVFGQENVYSFDYLNYPPEKVNNKLIEIVREFKPDIGFFQLQDTRVITPETLIAIKPYINFMTQWNGDIREVVPLYQQQIGKYFDVTYLGFDHIAKYLPFCNKVKLMMIAVDPTEVEPTQAPVMPLFDVTFIGNHYANQFPDSSTRLELIKVLKAKFNTKVLGNGWPDGIADGSCPVKEQSNWYANGRVALSINHFNNVKYYSERLLWCLGSGVPTVAMRTPDLEFEEGKHYLGFEDTNECVRQIELILQHPERFTMMGTLAQSTVIAQHNWTERYKQLRKDYDVANQHSR